MTLKSGVFPAPFGPRMARRSPGLTARVTSATARSPPNRRPTPLKWRIGAADSALGGAAFTPLCVIDSLAEADGGFVSNPGRWGLLGAGRVGSMRRWRGLAEEYTRRLVHLRDLKDGVDTGDLAACRRSGDLDDPVVEDRLAGGVETDLAVRTVDYGRGQRCLKRLLATGDVAVDLRERQTKRGHCAPVAQREDAGSIRLSGRVDGQLLLVGDGLRRGVIGGDAAGGNRAHHRGADGLEELWVGPERVAHDVLGVERPVELLVLLEECDQTRTTHSDEQPVETLGDLCDERGVVGRAERGPDAVGDVATDRAELRDESGERGVWERVVVADHGRGAPAERVVRVVAETGRPLRPVGVEAEEVRSLNLESRVLGARDAVEECLVRLRLGVVGHGDALVTGEGADHDVGAELFDEPPRLFDRFAGGGVGAAEADDLDVLACDLDAGHPVLRQRTAGFAAIVRSQHGEGAAQVVVVERPEVSQAVRQDADLDRARRRCRRVAVACSEHEQRECGYREQPPGAELTLVSMQIPLL